MNKLTMAVDDATLAFISSMDFISCLSGSRLAFRLLQKPERVHLLGEKFLVKNDHWAFACPDPRDFTQRLIDCFQFNSFMFYAKVKEAACMADYLALSQPAKFFNEAPISQEQAWSAWFIADVACEVTTVKDGAQIHREQALVDAMLLRYRNIVELVPMPEDGQIQQVTAAQTFQLKVETAGLIRAAEDLMSLTRELKEMWLFGPLRSLNEGEAGTKAKMKKSALAVVALIDSIMKGNGNQKSAEEKDEKQTGTTDEDDMEA